MKKLLIASVILLSSFLAISNVNASSRVLDQHNVHYINTNSMSDEEIKTFYNKFCLDSDNYNCYVDSNINVYINARNALINNSNYYFMYYDYGSIYNVYINENVMNARLVLSNNNENNLGFGIFSTTYNSYGYPQGYSYYQFNESNNSFSYYSTMSRFATLTEQNYSSNKENIYFFDTNYHKEVLYGIYAGYYIYDGDITYNNQTYSINSYLPIDIYDGLNPLNLGPKINISEIDSTYINVNSELEGQSFKTSAIYNISFSEYDEDKYNYLYSKDNENWIDIYNDYQLKVTENNRYYFKVTDKDNNTITSNSIDVTQLKPLDYIKVKFDVSNDSLEKNGYEISYRTLYDNFTEEFNLPYSEILFEKNNDIEYYGKSIELIENYADTYIDLSISNYKDKVKYYNFVIELAQYKDNLNFSLHNKSNHNFEIVYYFKNGDILTTGLSEYIDTIPFDYNFITLDVTNYEGIALTPKIWNKTSNLANYYNKTIYSFRDYSIYLNGVFNIHKKDHNDSSNSYVTDTDSYINGVHDSYYKFMNNRLNISEIIIEHDKTCSTGNNYITFDSELFNYYLISDKDEEIKIIDPITGDIMNGGTMNEVITEDELSKNGNDANSLLDRVSSFLDDMSKPILAIFDLFKYGYDRLNSTFKTFLIVAFIIILVSALIFKSRGD